MNSRQHEHWAAAATWVIGALIACVLFGSASAMLFEMVTR